MSDEFVANKKEKLICREHGAGGSGMHELISRILAQLATDSPHVTVPLSALDDSAVVDDVVFTTDAHTVKPLFFSGGDIGSLSVAGTVNDIAVMGATPLALSSAFVIEESFPFDDFDRIVASMKKTCEIAGVPVVTGDTKVVERGAIDRMVITTAAIGKRSVALDSNLAEVRRHRPLKADWLLDSNVRDGDAIIVSGFLGDHGVSLMAFREGFEFDTTVTSDVAPLNHLIAEALKVGGVVAAKDPTRGGIANLLNEFAEKSHVGIVLDEEALPIRESVRSACDVMGIDPLEVGNEGKVVMAVVKEKAEGVLEALRRHPLGKDAQIIGRAAKEIKGVILQTRVGGRRIVEEPIGDPIPRIC